MAILQLSRITHRKGLAENLPQLAGAEFGWVLDERKLYIGNGTIADGAPVIGNTEILTEFSDILALSSTYTYKGEAAGYVSVTGPSGESIVRSLQSKFDDFASVKDFGAVGDGETDDTDAINRALYELFCRELNVQVRRSLYFPAGNYKVTGTIKIPPHAKLFGEGLTSSIIQFSLPLLSVTEIVPTMDYIIQSVGTTDFTTIGAASNTVGLTFTATSAGIGTGTVKEVPANYVVETADNKQQTGASLGNDSAVLPTGIEMASMAIYSDEDNTLLKLDSVSNSGFYYIGLHGPNIDPSMIGNETSAVEIATSVAPVHDITLSKLDTYGTTYALRAEGETKGVVLENSGIDFHYKGVHVVGSPIIDATSIVSSVEYKIVSVGTTDFTAIGSANNNVGTVFTATGAGLGTGTVINTSIPSPTGIVISRNIFDNISQQGVHFGNVSFNSTGYNVFYNVGNNLGAVAVAPVVEFDSDKCVSIGDLFEREDESIYPRVALLGNGGLFIDGTHSIHLGSYERQIGIEGTLAGGATGETVFLFQHDSVNSYRVDYNIKRGANSRMGWLYISNDNLAVTYNDEYTQTGDLGITLDVIGSGTNSELQFTSSAGVDAQMNYSIVRLD